MVGLEGGGKKRVRSREVEGRRREEEGGKRGGGWNGERSEEGRK